MQRIQTGGVPVNVRRSWPLPKLIGDGGRW
jgi:hypothetical protein